jgi:hypothetical protein
MGVIQKLTHSRSDKQSLLSASIRCWRNIMVFHFSFFEKIKKWGFKIGILEIFDTSEKLKRQ